MFKKLFSLATTQNQLYFASLVLRIIGGGFMLTHGLPKLQKVLAGNFKFADPIGLGPEISLILTVAAEFGGALLLVLGLGTRLVSLPLMFTMIIAAFVAHGADPFGKKELALMYFGVYFALFLLGSGKFSLDAVFNKNKTV